MSGGSYEYLCYKEVDELFSRQDLLREMSDDLALLGYAKDAAKETEQLLLTIRQFENRLEAMKERLSPVWKAMEWWHSGDSGEDGVKKALEEYRQGNPNEV